MGFLLVGAADHAQILAVHAALLPTGHILYFAGNEHDRGQHEGHLIDHTRLYDCATGQVLPAPSPGSDVFCAGHAWLPDGRLLVAGGTQAFPGVPGPHVMHLPGFRDTWAFDPGSTTWTRVADLNPEPGLVTGGGRWYPTLLTLADGRVLALSGHPRADDSRHTNDAPEAYSLAPLPGGSWQIAPDDPAHTTSYYPRAHVVPGGSVVFATPVGPSGRSQRFRPWSGVWTDVTAAPPEPVLPLAGGIAWASVLLPLLPEEGYRPRLLLVGGTQAWRLDLGAPAPAWTPTGPRTFPGALRRVHGNAVLLPTGDVFVTGGVAATTGHPLDSEALLAAELYRPATDTWVTLESATVRRNYHSVALLMPDGRVWTAGSNRDAQQSFPAPGVDTRERRIELYEPGYTFGPRPAIAAAPTAVRCGARFVVQLVAPAAIGRVGVLRAGSVTHSFDGDQRCVALRFRALGPATLEVEAPPNTSVAPAGPYLLVVVDAQGVPSPGRFLRLDPPLLRWVVTGAGLGGGPHVRLWTLDVAAGVASQIGGGFFAGPAVPATGVFVAAADVDGDGLPEVVTGSGPGGASLVRLWKVDPLSGAALELAAGAPYPPGFGGGALVAAGDVDGDGRAEIVTGPGPGHEPRVNIFRLDFPGPTVTLLGSGLPYPASFTGGVPVAASDVDGDGRAEVVTAPGPGGVEPVRIFRLDPGGPIELASFFPYGPGFGGGVLVAAGDVDGDGRAEIVTGPGPGAGSEVRLFDVDPATHAVTLLRGFFPFGGFAGGAFVGAADVDGDGVAEVLVGAGPGGCPVVRVFKVDRETEAARATWSAYDPGFGGGVFVA